MKYRDINPGLTADIIKSAGFNFDGYYYVNPICPIRFNSDKGGFMPSFSDPAAPRFSKACYHYIEFIRILHQMIQPIIETSLSEKKFINDRAAQEFVTKTIHDIFAFDKEIKFFVQFIPGGFMPIPNNEYTYTLIDGSFKDFEMNWKMTNDENWTTTKFQINPQCISYPYLLQIIGNEHPEVKEGNDLPIIQEVKYISKDGYMQFFGPGIPKMIINDQKSDDENKESTEEAASESAEEVNNEAQSETTEESKEE